MYAEGLHCSRLLELRRISFSCAHIGFFGFVVSLLKQYTANSKKVSGDAIVARGSVDRALTTIDSKVQEATRLYDAFVILLATMEGESYDGMKVELELLFGETLADRATVTAELLIVQASISKDLCLTDDLIKLATQETQRLASVFLDFEAPYQLSLIHL